VKQEDVFAVDALLEQTYREEETEIVSWPIKMNIPEWILPEPEEVIYSRTFLTLIQNGSLCNCS